MSKSSRLVRFKVSVPPGSDAKYTPQTVVNSVRCLGNVKQLVANSKFLGLIEFETPVNIQNTVSIKLEDFKDCKMDIDLVNMPSHIER